MRNLLLLMAMLITVCSASGGHMPGEFARAEGTHFMLGRQRLYYLGANCFYLAYFAQDTSVATNGQTWRAMSDEVLDRCHNLGVKVIRIWAFNEANKQEFSAPTGDWRFQTSPGVYREQALTGLDYVLDRADELDMFLVLTIVNNWDDFGGMIWYVTNSPTTGGANHDEFYTDATCRQWYREYFETLAFRTNTINGRVYREDPTIFAWQLANEPRCQSDDSGAVVSNWIHEMAAHVKSIDTNHMVTTGEEGWRIATEPWEGTDWTMNNTCTNVDYVAIHCWPDAWSHLWGTNEPARYNGAMQWVADHMLTADTVLEKPFVLDEYGRIRPPGGPALDGPYGRDAYHEGWFNVVSGSAADDGAGAGMQFWMIEADNSGHGEAWGDGVYTWDTTSIAVIRRHANWFNQLITPTILQIGISTVGVDLAWSPVVGQPSYRVEVSDDLLTWSNAAVVDTNRWTDADAGGAERRFYRLTPEY